MRLLEQNTNEEIEKYRILLNQALAKKFRDELTFEQIRFPTNQKLVKGVTYIQGYVNVPQATIKNQETKSKGEIRFHLGKEPEVSEKLQHSGVRNKLVNDIKELINKKFNL